MFPFQPDPDEALAEALADAWVALATERQGRGFRHRAAMLAARQAAGIAPQPGSIAPAELSSALGVSAREIAAIQARALAKCAVAALRRGITPADLRPT